MAVYKPVEGIEYISGTLARGKKDGHNHGGNLLCTHRVAPTTSTQCNRIYLRKYQRSTRPSPDEISQRTDFGAVARMVNTRLHNQAQYAQDVVAFKAQTRFKTLRQYVWNLCTTEYYSNQG